MRTSIIVLAGFAGSGEGVSEQACYSALLTDLYEFTMAAAYFETGFNPPASFELFVRHLPANRGYLLAAGLEQALDYLERLHFTDHELEYLRRHRAFGQIGDGFFQYLKNFRFTGEVWAMPEGTPVMANEPMLRVTAPIIEAQIVETFLLSIITFQTSVATKAARMVEAAQGRGVVEFGSRRAHGPDAGMLAARAAYVGGCVGTSNVEAGHRFGVPTSGTMAHSFVMAYGDEEESFRHFQRLFPETTVLLLDTYDTLAAVDKIIALGLRPSGVRLDSGDLVALSQEVRRRLDAAGLSETRIFASGDLNEHKIADLIARGAKIDAFGVGTALATSQDAPALGGVYKLVEIAAERTHYVAKFSADKATYPGVKQVYRFADGDGHYDHDLIACASERFAEGEPLLQCVMRAGQRTAPAPPLQQVREHARQRLGMLPKRYRATKDPAPYPVRTSAELDRLLEQVRTNLMEPEIRKR